MKHDMGHVYKEQRGLRGAALWFRTPLGNVVVVVGDDSLRDNPYFHGT